jgi:hypothetical protein
MVMNNEESYNLSIDKEETGWKLIHGDVFRLPRNENLLAALLGNGAQLLSLLFCILVLALLGVFYPDYSYRTMYTTLIFVYVLTTGKKLSIF